MTGEPVKPEKDERTGRFLTGNIGGGGRPKGARNKLGEAFLDALHEDFNEHGQAAIVQVRTEKPDQYLKVIASILPRDLNVNINPNDEMTDEQLIERIRSLDAAIRPFLNLEAASGIDGGTGPATAH
jgi:hypothetical protein